MSSPLFDKQAVAAGFSKAASTYDSVSAIQRAAAEWLLALVRDREEVDVLIDVGCGTGATTQKLAERMSFADIHAVDIAPGMIDAACAQHPSPFVQYQVADAEDLPWDDGQAALVFSNFMLQWCPRPAVALAEMHRVLRTRGQLVLSMPGRGTLGELAQAWRAAEGADAVHVHAFPDEDWLADLADAAGFDEVEVTSSRQRLWVPDARTLMRELKALGAHNQHPDRRGTLTGKARLARMVEAYESLRTPQGLPVTWNVLLLDARRRPAVNKRHRRHSGGKQHDSRD